MAHRLISIPLGLNLLLAHRSIFSSNIIYNRRNLPLTDIVSFGLSLPTVTSHKHESLHGQNLATVAHYFLAGIPLQRMVKYCHPSKASATKKITATEEEEKLKKVRDSNRQSKLSSKK